MTAQDNPYLFDAIEYGQRVKRFNRNAFSRDLMAALAINGATIEQEPAEFGHDAIAYGDVRLSVAKDHKGAAGRVRVAAWLARSLMEAAGLDTVEVNKRLPDSITFDSARPMAQLAKAVMVNLVDPMADVQKWARAKRDEHGAAVSNLDAAMVELRRQYPFLSVGKRNANDTEAGVYGNQGGGYLTGRLYADGRIYVERCDYKDRDLFLRAIFGEPYVAAHTECGEVAGSLLRFMRPADVKNVAESMDGAARYVLSAMSDETMTVRSEVCAALHDAARRKLAKRWRVRGEDRQEGAQGVREVFTETGILAYTAEEARDAVIELRNASGRQDVAVREVVEG